MIDLREQLEIVPTRKSPSVRGAPVLARYQYLMEALIGSLLFGAARSALINTHF
jgi:hypothetical protein